MLAFDGETLPDAMARRLAEAPAAGITLFRHLERPVAGAGSGADRGVPAGGGAAAWPAAGRRWRRRRVRAAPHRGRPGGRPVHRARRRVDAVRREHGARRGRRRRAHGARRPGDRHRGAGDGRQRRLRAGARRRLEPGQPGARDPLVRRRPGAGRRGTVRRWSAASSRPAWPRRSSTSRVPARRPTTRTTASRWSVRRARALMPVSSCRSGRPSAAGARVAMSAHIALPAVSGRDDLPSTLSRAVMTDLLRGDLGFDGVSITDALDMAGRSRRVPTACPTSSPRSRPASTSCSRPRTPRRTARIERALVGRRAAQGVFDAAEWPPRNVVLARSGRGSARPAPRPDLASSAAPSIGRSPRSWRRARSRSSATRGGLLPAPAARLDRSRPRGHAPTRPT